MSDTTLVALRSDTNERITVGDLPLNTLRTLSDEHLLWCVECGNQLTLKAGPVRVRHFAHTSLSECSALNHEPESDSHRQGKLLLYQRFRAGATSATLEQRLPVTDQRADVFIRMPDGISYALEFQQANNSVEHWTERHTLYQSSGIADIWFLGQVRYQERRVEPLRPISPYDPLPVPRNVFGVMSGSFQARELEKAICVVEPLLYFLNPENGDLTALLVRDLHGNTLRAYRYQLPLAECALRDGRLWTPLDPLLDEYRRYLAERSR